MLRAEALVEQGNSPLSRRPDRLRSLHEFTFSLNIFSAAAYALLICVFRNLTSEIPQNDLGYYFLRSAVRINDFLHLPLINPVTTDTVGRENPSHWRWVGEELAILVPVIGAACMLFLVLKLIAGTKIHRLLVNYISLVTALFAAPGFCLYASLARQWTSMGDPQLHSISALAQNILLRIFIAELLSTIAIFAIYRWRSMSTVTIAILLVLHYGLWIVVLKDAIPQLVDNLIMPTVLLIVFPLSGAIWLFYFMARKKSGETQTGSSAVSKWILVSAAISALALVLAWLPSITYSFAQPRDLKSVTIEISRGPCFGMCPSYNIVIHGTGQIEYVGYGDVKVQGKRVGAARTEQVSQILQILNRDHFFAIEDRAFAWCFDSPSVGISLSVDGKTKRVVSDGSCTGARSGVQARFVQAAHDIDGIIESDLWTKCEGRCGN